VSVEAPADLERRMTVRVPSAEIEQEVDARLARVGRTAKLKGFRPGKIPAKVVRQRYGTQVREEVLSEMIRSSYSQAIAQENLKPAGGPQIEPLRGDDDSHFSYRATFEVYPQIMLKPVEELRIERPRIEIQDADVDDVIRRLREQRADWRVVERAAAPGDRVVVDFLGKIGKEPFEGGEGKEVPMIVGSGEVLEDFDKALKGLSAGETKSAKVKFPKDYGVESLAGKKAVFEITAHRVEERILPELDEKFFEAFGVEEGGLDGLRKQARATMERELTERLRTTIRRNCLDSLLEANPVTVPKALVEQEVTTLQAATMRRMGVEDPAQAPPREGFVETAERRVGMALLVRELIREKEIELDRSRLDRRVEELASGYEKPQEAAQLYRRSRELMAQLESEVLESQVVDYLLEHATVEEKAVGFKAFMDA
jgi:trigger factor